MPSQFHPDSLPNLTGRVYIVTGATSGIGFHTAARLAQHSAHVYICARTSEKGTLAIQKMATLYPSHPLNISILPMDHTNLSTITNAAKTFLSRETQLHGLVNNAGVMATPFKMTCDGWEEQWQVNYLAHWVFTSLLVPVMLETSKREKGEEGSVRIVNLSSSGHYGAPTDGIHFADTSLEAESGMTRYGQSKLANILHAKTLHKMYGPDSLTSSSNHGNIWVSTVHPGFVKSDIGINAQIPFYMRAAVHLARWAGMEIDADMGAWTSLHCVAGRGMKREECGKYWQRVADPEGWQSGLAGDEGMRERLEEWTVGEMGRWIG